MPMDRFLNLVYYFAVEDAEPKDKAKFDARLQMPDARARQRPEVAERGPWSPQAETAALGNLVAQLSGVPK
jgi:hypothetical protein